jgi:hypothetical protein
MLPPDPEPGSPNSGGGSPEPGNPPTTAPKPSTESPDREAGVRTSFSLDSPNASVHDAASLRSIKSVSRLAPSLWTPDRAGDAFGWKARTERGGYYETKCRHFGDGIRRAGGLGNVGLQCTRHLDAERPGELGRRGLGLGWPGHRRCDLLRNRFCASYLCASRSGRSGSWRKVRYELLYDHLRRTRQWA